MEPEYSLPCSQGPLIPWATFCNMLVIYDKEMLITYTSPAGRPPFVDCPRLNSPILSKWFFHFFPIALCNNVYSYNMNISFIYKNILNSTFPLRLETSHEVNFKLKSGIIISLWIIGCFSCKLKTTTDRIAKRHEDFTIISSCFCFFSRGQTWRWHPWPSTMHEKVW